MAPPRSARPQDTGAQAQAPAVPFRVRLSTLRTRKEFLRVAQGRKQVSSGFILQGRKRGDEHPTEPSVRVGYTASRKVGNAVARNRAKRRLRAVAAQVLGAHGRHGWDYVLVARRNSTASMPFQTLLADLSRALDRLHGSDR